MTSDSNPIDSHIHAWVVVAACCLLALGLAVALYVLAGFPLPGAMHAARRADRTVQTVAAQAAPVAAPSPQPASPPAGAAPAQAGASPAVKEPAAQPAPASAAPASPNAQTEPDLSHQARSFAQWNMLDAIARGQQRQAERLSRVAAAAAIFLAIFAVIAVLVLTEAFLQRRVWRLRLAASQAELEAGRASFTPLLAAERERSASLVRLVHQLGDGPVTQEELGEAFTPEQLQQARDIERLLGSMRYAPTGGELEDGVIVQRGLLIAAVAHLQCARPGAALDRLDEFFTTSSNGQRTSHRLAAQAHSYRALAAYRLLAEQEAEPSWLRAGSTAEALKKQAYQDVAEAANLDPSWKHAPLVEALLCSRFFAAAGQTEPEARSSLTVKGLRRTVEILRTLVQTGAYVGPARLHLACAMKRIAELTGEKSDFSDFGFALNAFPSDEDLAGEAAARRNPASNDRFLWQWMLGEEELFGSLQAIHLAEYRAFWIRMLDTKVRLRNWRADLEELQRLKPAMRQWAVHLAHAESPVSLGQGGLSAGLGQPAMGAVLRRPERFDSPSGS